MSDLATFVPKKKCVDIRGAGDLFIYLRQNPRTFVSSIAFFGSGIFLVVLVIALALGHPNFTFYTGGAAGIILCVYGFTHFRTLMNLKEQVDEYAKNNQKFRKENGLLEHEVDRLDGTKKELANTQLRLRKAIRKQKQNLKKLGSLNENLKTLGDKKRHGITQLHEMSAKMCDKWREQLIKKQKRILNICFERFPFESGRDGFTHEQYLTFRRLLPMAYQLKLAKKGAWKEIAGEDGILQYQEFVELMDNFAEEEVLDRYGSAPSSANPSKTLRGMTLRGNKQQYQDDQKSDH